MEITSRSNELIKTLKSQVKNKDLIVLDTPKLIEEAKLRNVEISYLFCLPEKAKQFDNAIITNESILKTFCNVETSAGVVALVPHIKKKEQLPKGRFLVLDNVQDPGNVGTLIRSALGANFCDVFLLNSASVANPKVVRSSMGAVFALNVYEMEKSDFVQFAKSKKLTLFVADMNGDDIFLHPPQDDCFGLVIGNEGSGVSKEILDLNHKTIKIPMDNNLESLNAAVSGSILMYQIRFGGK